MITKQGFISFLSRNRNKSDRPHIRPGTEPVDWLLEALALLGLLFLAGFLLYQYPRLPGTIPSHFNAAGQPDGYSGRGSILFLPGVSLFVYILLTLVALIPQNFNYLVKITPENAPRQYALAVRFIRYMKTLVIWLFFFITLAAVRTATGETSGLGLWFMPVFLGLVFIPMIVYFVLASRKR